MTSLYPFWCNNGGPLKRKQMTELLSCGGSHLYKWLTNDREVLARSLSETDPRDSSSWVRIIYRPIGPWPSHGCSWWYAQVYWTQKWSRHYQEGSLKSSVLSLGFARIPPPVLNQSKIILQSLNRMKYGWDVELKEADLKSGVNGARKLKHWMRWRFQERSWISTKLSEKPRCTCSLMLVKTTMAHVPTWDESLKRKRLSGVQARCRERESCAFESKVYLQTWAQGALIAARLAETLVAEMMTKIEKVVFWCDSTTVLH